MFPVPVPPERTPTAYGPPKPPDGVGSLSQQASMASPPFPPPVPPVQPVPSKFSEYGVVTGTHKVEKLATVVHGLVLVAPQLY